MAHKPGGSLSYVDLQQRFGPDSRVELIDGEPFLLDSSGFDHQHAAIRLAVAFQTFADDHDGWTPLLAPMDLRLAADTVLQPDAMIVGASPESLRGSSFVSTAELVVEVVSPSAAARDWITKRGVYEHHGIPEYWLVDVDARTLTTQVVGEDGRYGRPAVVEAGDEVAATAVPGLRIEVASLFA